MRQNRIALTGWSRTQNAACDAVRPERMQEAQTVFGDPVSSHPHGLIVHAAGRSYGDCALNSGGGALVSTRLDRILAFDAQTGLLQVEPGVNFRRLLDVFLPRGFLVPVIPGTGFATIGGAVANDVHGKNHELNGSFGQHVTELDILTPDGVLRTIDPANEPDIFRATIGGIGLTGLITRVAFRMQAIPGPSVTVSERRVENLDAFLAAMADAQNASYVVGWIDGTARGAKLGRGILEVAEPSTDTKTSHAGKQARIPLDFPGFVLNPFTVSLFNEAYYHRVPQNGRTRITPYAQFLYPLDAIQDWNRIYGRQGFYQFQCVVPFSTGEIALRRLLEVISISRQASFLAVLKRMGPGRAGFLSFPMAGFTLALDFPAGGDIPALYEKLVGITLNHGGRIYLGKDALLGSDAFAAMYPDLADFRRVLTRIDPEARMQSDMSRRLGLRETRA